MNKAFIFDMDGVIVNSEQIWETYEGDFFDKMLGKEIAQKIGNTVGMSIDTTYQKACALGLQMSKQTFRDFYDKTAYKVYDRSKVTPNIDKLIAFLLDNNFKIGLVSASPKNWIDKVVSRLSFADKIDHILSIDERSDLAPKPAPDGYIETMKFLGSDSTHTIILEDSNAGITAALNSKAYTIAFTHNLVEGYNQIEGDTKAGTMNEVIEIVKKRLVT